MSNISGLNTGFWSKKLASLPDLIEIVGGVWVDQKIVRKSLDRISAALENDLKALRVQASFIFSTKTEVESLTGQNVELLRRWQMMGDSPSLTALSIFALEHFRVFAPEDLLRAVLIASVLGEVENDLSYHNNMHYRKVLLQLIRMISVHNDIYAGTARAFDEQQIGLLITAACMHDLGHDGKGNTVKGVFEQGRLERRSFELALPYFKAAGLNDPEALEAIKVMLLCTEVTPLGDPGNPMSQMKSAYRYHFLGHKTKTHTLNLDPDLARLQRDHDLVMMSLVLHEADIATSAGLSYAVTKYETIIYMQEIKKEQACPQHVVDFLNQICQRQMLSDAAQRLYAANMARIYALAEEDVKNGDQSFPPPQHSDFLLAHGAGDTAGTIN